MGRDKRKKRYDESESSSSTEASESDSSADSETASDSDHDRRHHTKKRKDKHSSKHRKSSTSSKHRKHSTSTSDRKDSERKKKKIEHETLTEDDYFKKSSEFRSWLSNERGIYFSDLSSSKSRKLFLKFVRKWNSGHLKKKYYDGIQSSSLEHSSQSHYKWKLTGHDNVEMGSVRDRVSSWTSGKGEEFGNREAVAGPERPRPIGPVFKGPERPPAEYLDPHLWEEKQQEKRKVLQKSRKDFRKHHELVMDELLPKATGHEAKIAKRRVMNQQRRERETSPDIDTSSLMGSGPRDSIQARIKSKQDNRERRAQVATQKISDYKEKEKSKVAAILEMARANKKEGSLW